MAIRPGTTDTNWEINSFLTAVGFCLIKPIRVQNKQSREESLRPHTFMCF